MFVVPLQNTTYRVRKKVEEVGEPGSRVTSHLPRTPSATLPSPPSKMTTATEPAAAAATEPVHAAETTLTEYAAKAIRAEAQRFQKRFGLWPPETHEWPCDLHEQWAREWLEANRGFLDALLKDGTAADFAALLSEVFKEDIWTSNRRAFFAALHKLAIKHEDKGGQVSAELVRFYRERYNAPHKFVSERAPYHVFIPSIFQKPAVISDDED